MNKIPLWKALALLLAVVAVAAGCSGDESTDAGDDGTDAEAVETDTDDGETGETDTEDGETDTDDGETDTDIVENTQASNLLVTVQERGELLCGVSGSAVGFSETKADGSITGFDADYCRVVAAAIFGDAKAVTFVPLTAAERFDALKTGVVDLLMRNTTWTQSRDTEVGLDFGPTTYYDGQQLMARADKGFSGSSQVADIEGAIVCTNAGTTTEKNIADAAAAAGIDITIQTYEDFDIVTDNFINGSCDVVTTDGSGLVGRKDQQQPDDQEWVIFPQSPISKEPLGPTYRQNDSVFADVVNWAVYATFIADEKGITSENVDDKVVEYNVENSADAEASGCSVATANCRLPWV